MKHYEAFIKFENLINLYDNYHRICGAVIIR
jgi:hypothetical protein